MRFHTSDAPPPPLPPPPPPPPHAPSTPAPSAHVSPRPPRPSTYAPPIRVHPRPPSPSTSVHVLSKPTLMFVSQQDGQTSASTVQQVWQDFGIVGAGTGAGFNSADKLGPNKPHRMGRLLLVARISLPLSCARRKKTPNSGAMSLKVVVYLNVPPGKSGCPKVCACGK